MADILDEALEDIKEERVARLFLIGSKIFVALLVVFLVSSIGYYAWNKFQEKKIYALGAEYLVAIVNLQSKDYQHGVEIMEKLSTNDISYSALAGLSYASFISAKQEFSKAEKVYGMVADNKDYAGVFRDFATLMQISMRLNTKEIDANQAIEQLKDYLKGNPIFKDSANEQIAALYLSLDNKVKAREVLTEIIASQGAADALKAQAKEMMVLATS